MTRFLASLHRLRNRVWLVQFRRKSRRECPEIAMLSDEIERRRKSHQSTRALIQRRKELRMQTLSGDTK